MQSVEMKMKIKMKFHGGNPRYKSEIHWSFRHPLIVVRVSNMWALLIVILLAVGAIPSSFDCYLVNRGLKTLHVRMQRHYENALTIAKFLEANPRVEKV